MEKLLVRQGGWVEQCELIFHNRNVLLPLSSPFSFLFSLTFIPIPSPLTHTPGYLFIGEAELLGVKQFLVRQGGWVEQCELIFHNRNVLQFV
jgi:hypothetical protein